MRGVSGTGSVYTVAVNTGSGSGTLRLDIPIGASVSDLAGNPLDGLPYTSGATYSIRPVTFDDVSTNYWEWQFIERLYNAGITGGCSIAPLNYCPNNTVTRAEMAIFLLRGIHGPSYSPPAVGGTTDFTDVPVGYWAGNWIEQLAVEGITSGCGGSNYCPDNSVTRAEMAVFLVRTFSLP